MNMKHLAAFCGQLSRRTSENVGSPLTVFCHCALFAAIVFLSGCGGGSLANSSPQFLAAQTAATEPQVSASLQVGLGTDVSEPASIIPTGIASPSSSNVPPVTIAAPEPIAPVPPPEVLADLKAGSWLELPNTKIRSVLPSPAPPGSPRALILAWGGGTVDTNRNRLLVWGGGHADYWGNEIYALDLGTLTVKRLTDPSPVAGSATCTSALSDNTPTSRHTYDGLAYIAHLDWLEASNGALSPCGYMKHDTWNFNFSTGTWTLATNTSPVGGYGVMTVYDPATKLVYAKDVTNFFSYSADTNVYTKLNVRDQHVDYHLSAAIDSKRRKFVMIGDGVQVIDLRTNEMVSLATTNAPALVTGKQSPGVAYDPVADRIVAWQGGPNVYALDMDTLVWSQVAKTPGPTAEAPRQGTFGRWGYVPQYHLFVLVNDIDENAWVFKLSQ